uniref:mRNA-decapping enzyme-like protein n=1 Tax=Ananas comosus var. bracteatus TaxID=296719 RepID=A0A6V7NH67_ANACO|nr:unnamed protein product [Ananas comosus var. bracteatus]
MTAAHVTFYEFNIEHNQWSEGREGSLFVVKRNTQPRFQFIVMNRRNTDNLVEDLLGDFEYEVQVPYILYRNAAQEVNGIWILNAYSKVPPKPKVSTNKSSEFEELEAVPTLSVIEGPLEPPTTATSTAVPDAPDDSFVNFFTAATNIGNASNSANAAPLNVAPKPAPTIPLSTHPPVAAPSPMPPVQPSPPLQPSSTPLMPLLDTTLHESVKTGSSSSSRPADLVKPSFFSPIPPASSAHLMMPPMMSPSMPTAPPLHPPVTMQRPPPYGTPLLQPFPPPAHHHP